MATPPNSKGPNPGPLTLVAAVLFTLFLLEAGTGLLNWPWLHSYLWMFVAGILVMIDMAISD